MRGDDRHAVALHDLGCIDYRETMLRRRDAVAALRDGRGRETLWRLAG